MTEPKSTARKDTGRTDKYSDETPKKDFADFRVDSPKAVEEASRPESRHISQGIEARHFIGIPGLKAASQYLTTVGQNFRETFAPADLAKWKAKADAATRLYAIISTAQTGKIDSNFTTEVRKCLDILK